MDWINKLKTHLLEDGCRCSNEFDIRKCCGFLNNPPKCAHMLASEALGEIDDIAGPAMRRIAALTPNVI